MTIRRYPFSALRFGSRNASRSVGVSTVVTGAPPVESNPVRLQRVERLPHPRLRSSLRGGYAAYVTTGDAGLILPATTSVLLVMKVEDSPLRPPQFVTGAHGSYSVVVGACAPLYVEVPLAPIAAYRVLGRPLDELSRQMVDLDDVLGPDGARLGDVVRDAPSWQQSFDRIDRFLLDRLDSGPEATPEVAEAWRRLNATDGRIPIRALAAGVGWSHKHLIAKFQQQVGLAPKRAARLVRFERVLHRIDHERSPDWGMLAAELGYADQPHLTREFAEFTGTSPAAYLTGRPRGRRR